MQQIPINCYYDYSTGERILIPGCYGSLYDEPENCTCENGIHDPGGNTFDKLDDYEIDIENLFHESSIEDSDYLRLLEKISILKEGYLTIQKEVIALEITLSNLKNPLVSRK